MGYKSHGTPQRIARRIQLEQLEREPVIIEKGIKQRQEICKHSRRTDVERSVIRITKRARKLHGNIF